MAETCSSLSAWRSAAWASKAAISSGRAVPSAMAWRMAAMRDTYVWNPTVSALRTGRKLSGRAKFS